MCLYEDHKEQESSSLWVQLHKFQLDMRETHFVKFVILYLVKKGEAFALLQKIDI